MTRGLSTADVEIRRARFGTNTLPEAARRGFALVFIAQFRDLMVVLLLVAGVVASLVGETADLVAIALIVALNALLGAVQEHRAERALASLKRLAAPTARVRRDGTECSVPATALVIDDVVLLEAGNVVPADVRLDEAVNLYIAEAALTGESEPIPKSAADEAYQGTTVATGRGVGVVVRIGVSTRLGDIAQMLRRETEPPTPLQRRLKRLGGWLALASIVICAIIFAGGVVRGDPFVQTLMTALAVAVAAVPEALPAVVTMGLAIGARGMARRNALIRRLPAVETLGSVTFICSDKTGTLTEGRMEVEAVRGSSSRLFDALALSNDVFVSPDAEMAGDPTEVALCRHAANAGVMKARREREMPRIAELSFSADRARMTTLHRGPTGNVIAFTKGAPERVLPACDTWWTNEASSPIDRGEALRAAEAMARNGLRVIAVAARDLASLPADLQESERSQTLLGLVGLLDPPRKDAADAVRLCQSAGIRVVMITGDHAATARTIAGRLGIAGPDASLLSGAELRALSDEELAERVESVRVYARVSPEDKLRIVKALQARGEFVAMTGDGVNDAPALRRADIGVAMGRSGTDVARDASAMVLLDDRFATIVDAVREGRRIYDNIRKFILYVLSGNLGEVLVLLLAPLFGMPLPLLPIQVLWVNLVTDGLPGIALALEPAERDLMRHPPRPPSEGVLANGMWRQILWRGALIGALTLGVQAIGLRDSPEHWQTMTFCVLTFAQMCQALSIRSESRPSLGPGAFSNPALLGAVGLTVVLQVAILYVPALQGPFRTHALTLDELALVIGASIVSFLAGELYKLVRSRSAKPHAPIDRHDPAPSDN